MEHNYLGRSGLLVSNICLGTMTFGKTETGPIVSYCTSIILCNIENIYSNFMFLYTTLEMKLLQKHVITVNAKCKLKASSSALYRETDDKWNKHSSLFFTIFLFIKQKERTLVVVRLFENGHGAKIVKTKGVCLYLCNNNSQSVISNLALIFLSDFYWAVPNEFGKESRSVGSLRWTWRELHWHGRYVHVGTVWNYHWTMVDKNVMFLIH